MEDLSQRLAGLSAEQRAELLARLSRKLTEERKPAAEIPRRTEDSSAIPLSYQQEQLWFLERLAPSQPTYNIPIAFRLAGPLDETALRQALLHIVRRHDALRTRFTEVAGVSQQIVDSPEDFQAELVVEDLSDLDPAGRPEAAHRRLQEDIQRPFDLHTGPLFRSLLLRLAEQEHLLAITMHHICSDGWSTALVKAELASCYNAFHEGRQPDLAELPVQYADYATWQRKQFGKDVFEQQLEYWEQQLAGLPTLELPSDRPRPATLSYRSRSVSSTLRPGLLTELRTLAASRNASLFMVLMAAYLTVLARYSDAEELVVGTTTTGRDQAELRPLIGYFVNMIVLRTKVGDDPSFAELLDRVRGTVLEAWRHQQVPFDMVVQRLQPPRDPSRNPFFQVGLQLLGSETQGIEPALSGLAVESVDVNPDGHPFDMSITASESRDELRLLLEYSTDLFDEPRMRRLLGHLETVLAAVVAKPDTPLSAIQLLTEAELDCLLDSWQGPPAQRFTDPVHAQIHDFAVSHPTAIAAKVGDREYTFAELDERSHQLALALREHGVGHGDIVALFIHRGFELMVGMLAAQKAGGAFVVLDITHPENRLEYILSDTAAKVVLTSGELTDRLPAEQGWHAVLFEQALATDHAGAELVEWADQHSLAYVLYTSGSSGRPKGVLVEHHALSTFIHWLSRLFDFGPGVRLLQHMAPGFDFAVGEFFTSMAFGVTIVFVPEGYRTNPEVIGELLERERINYVGGPPTILGRVPMREFPDLRYLIGGGEALTGELVNRWNTPQRRFINGYGPTEATIGCSFYECEHRVWSGQPPIGRAMPNRVAYVLGPSDTLQPVGVPGEIVVGGEGLARGYLNLPEMTAEKFVDNPFRPGERMYRTGDLGVWTEDGQIQFLGRVDTQVKLNGLRIELEEIESALAAHPLVREAAVAVRDGAGGLATLIGYVVPAGSEQPAGEQLREHLLHELPPYMVPLTYLVLDELPLTNVGKVDRRALPDPEPTSDAAKPFVEVETAAQRQVADIFQQVLGIPQVGAADSFFDIGGSSLDAARVLSRITEATGAEITMRDFYANSRVDQVATLLDQLTPATPAELDEDGEELDSEIAELERRLAEARNRLAKKEKPAAQAARRFQPGEHAPLSPAQEQLWFLDQLAPGEPTYNMAAPIRLTGPFDLELAEATLARLLARHDALRTRFGSDAEGPYQMIVEDPPVRLPLTDLSHLAADQREAELERELREDARQPFDLRTDLPFRARVIRLDSDQHVLSLVMHHICSDGWSVGVFMRDFAEIYDASHNQRPVRLPELHVQYAAAAARLREQARAGEWDAHVDYWVGRLAGATPLELPTDRPRPPVASNRGALLVYRMPSALLERLHAFSRSEQVSSYATLLTGFTALLQRYSGQDDLLVGTSSSGRDRTELEDLVGFFVNILPLRLDLSGSPTFREAVRRTMGTLLEGWEHQAAPFEQVVERLNQPRDPSRNPVFTVSLDMLNANLIDLAVPGLDTEFLDIDPLVSRFDMAINSYDGADGLTFRVEYSTDLFDAERIEAMFGYLEHLLDDALADPDHRLDTIALLTEAETSQLLAWGDGGRGPAGAADLCRMFAETLDRHPDRIAVRQDGRDYTYRQLAGRTAQLLDELKQAGVRAGDLVPVLLPRGLDEVAALLAIQHAGAAYLPLDADCPPHRLARQLSDAATQWLVTTSGHAERLTGLKASPILLDLLPATDDGRSPQPAPEVDGRSLAYVLHAFDAGGEPKGVPIEHAMLTNYLAWMVGQGGLGAEDRMLHCAAPASDLAIAEVLAAVCAGATLVPASPAALADPAALAELVRRERVTHLLGDPAVIGRLPAGDYPELRVVMVAGGQVDPELINRWTADPARRVFHLYGPPEGTIACAWFDCTGGQYHRDVPIGRMMPNRHCYLLDPSGNLVPPGLPGELALGGAGVARGYLNRPELTEAAFVADPYRPDGAVYRSGDLARWNSDGQLEFVGRRDGQVMLRGLRVELGEIEQVLRSHPSVGDAMVALRDGGTERAALVGYLVTAEPLAEPSALAGYLAEFLPRHLIPSSWLVLEELPRGNDGKLDRSALAGPVPAAGPQTRVPARTATENAVAAVFAELLEVADISVGDEFFSIGGNSLQAIRAVSRINEACDVELSVREFYSGASVAGLAALIDQRAEQLRLEQEQLLASVENMTDEEVERLLSGE